MTYVGLPVADRCRSSDKDGSGHFVYVDAVLPNGDLWPLFRLRYGGSVHYSGFAFYAASSSSYEDSILPTGAFEGTPEEVFDCACGTYLAEPSAWLTN